MMQVSAKQALDQALMRSDGHAAKAVLQDADAYNFMLSIFTHTLSMASGSKTDIALAMTGKVLATTDLVAKGQGADTVLISSAALKIILSSLSLLSLGAKATPGAVISTAGAMLASKLSIALGMAGDNDKKAKCIAAFADIAAAVGTGAAGIMTAPATGGLSALLLVGSVSQFILGVNAAYQSCRAPGR